ncbi:ribonuclease H-like domain-containing protein [candidate division KSB1 bacterium]
MLTPDAHNRLTSLNKGKLKHLDEKRGGNPSGTAASRPNDAVHEPALRIHAGSVIPIPIEKAVPGQITKEDDGEFLLIKRRMKDICEDAGVLHDLFTGAVRITQNSASLNGTVSGSLIRPEKILFLDIETCGLTANPLFLIGVAYFSSSDFILLQMFARDYDEERPLLSFFSRFIAGYDLIVTYNGRSFDLPFIRTRAYENRIHLNTEKQHLDLLFEVRRLWKAELPDCKLQTVEQHILEQTRSGDIPGSEIPRVYHDYVQTRNIAAVQTILKHNILDVVSLIRIIILTAGKHKAE